ncbi:Protein-tyrosine phosphatase [Dictyocaulus viviparus]|uniref:Protein-tyrosine phosphatase n=1 Tax=Dictyocaulus viviparus TaxID=29172 RepID=A0A0D8XMG6_DICVI|nr:Protein-tyrosine phosphatase [Dictyocaulus viviparus]
MSRANVIEQIFDSECTSRGEQSASYGTSDFIHANYVRGGSLLNTFICTQAPLQNTQADFWRMVYQERSKFIIMLCSAVDKESLGPLDRSSTPQCSYYWPRSVGDYKRYGSLLIRNVRVDRTIDPLFNVTYLQVQPVNSNNESDQLTVEHWQWDWQQMCDVHWPFRVLRKARLQQTPTIVQCLDGCGRSGTLVTIEAVLMQFLRGSPLDDEVVFLSALFVRLQRRLAVSSPLHYLFIYRTVLHWISPYVTSIRQRFALGLSWPGIGFVAKYESMKWPNDPFPYRDKTKGHIVITIVYLNTIQVCLNRIYYYTTLRETPEDTSERSGCRYGVNVSVTEIRDTVDQEMEKFEEVLNPRPAQTHIRSRKLKWKKGTKRNANALKEEKSSYPIVVISLTIIVLLIIYLLYKINTLLYVIHSIYSVYTTDIIAIDVLVI